jgi:hypothetical protein
MLPVTSVLYGVLQKSIPLSFTGREMIHKALLIPLLVESGTLPEHKSMHNNRDKRA